MDRCSHIVLFDLIALHLSLRSCHSKPRPISIGIGWVPSMGRFKVCLYTSPLAAPVTVLQTVIARTELAWMRL